jgi:hypothetical protein
MPSLREPEDSVRGRVLGPFGLETPRITRESRCARSRRTSAIKRCIPLFYRVTADRVWRA